MTIVRLKVWNSAGTDCLTTDGLLPSVRVEGDATGDPSRLIAAIRQQVGVDVALLRVCDADLMEVELLSDPSLAARWEPQRMKPAVLQREGWQPHPMEPPAPQREWWQQPGWLSRALGELDPALAAAGRRRTGPAQQMRHTTITGLLCVPTDRGEVWLKAVPPAFRSEGPVTQWLSRESPGLIPQVIAHRRHWWAAEAFPPADPGPPTGDHLEALARLQIKTLGREGELRALGCPERSPKSWTAEMYDLMGADLLPRLVKRVLNARLNRLERILQATSLGATLVHGDLNHDNVRWSANGWFIYDWTDACLSHPFVDVELAVNDGCDPRGFARIWAQRLPETLVARELLAAPLLGAAFQVANYFRILQNVDMTAADRSCGTALTLLLCRWAERLNQLLDV